VLYLKLKGLEEIFLLAGWRGTGIERVGGGPDVFGGEGAHEPRLVCGVVGLSVVAVGREARGEVAVVVGQGREELY
jgi:hypothetical protein